LLYALNQSNAPLNHRKNKADHALLAAAAWTLPFGEGAGVEGGNGDREAITRAGACRRFLLSQEEKVTGINTAMSTSAVAMGAR